MSHAVVLVTRVDEEPVEAQMEPFNEQGEEDDYFMEKEYYVERNSKSVKEWLENEEKSIRDIINNPKVEASAKEYWNKTLNTLAEIKATKEVDKQLEKIRDYNGGGEDEEGLYWLSNPNAKWDWWTEGGRWNGWLITKSGEKVNSCKLKDIDWDAIRKQDMQDAARYYDEEVANAKKYNREPSLWGYDKFPTKEEYLKKSDEHPYTYAILHDGEWMEKGLMGWFGIDDPKFSEEDWKKKFVEIIDSLDPETEVAIVDYHI